jgi:hypothetical protein
MLVGCVCQALGADLPRPPADTPPPSIREMSAGVWQVGAMRVDRGDDSVRFPALVNMTNGLLEYVLVHVRGKDHESLLTTEVPPYHLQVAMLLLGARGADPKLLTNAPPSGPIRSSDQTPAQPPVAGDPVEVEVEWRDAKGLQRQSVSGWLRNRTSGGPMSSGRWTFSGSMVWEGAFIAQIEGSIIAVITDISAMFNNPRPDRDIDSLWEANSAVLPPEGTAVTVIIRRHRVRPQSETAPGK